MNLFEIGVQKAMLETRNQFGYLFPAIQTAETVTFGPLGVYALGLQPGRKWELLNPPGADDALTGMEADQRYAYGRYSIT